LPLGHGRLRTYSRRSLHAQVATDIGGRIMRGEFAPGEVLPNESDFSAALKVSRTALREAIKVLAAKGLVESRPKTGTRVRAREQWNMLDPDVLAWQFAATEAVRFAEDLFEVRRIIEPAAAALASARAEGADLDAIEAAYSGMEAAGSDLEASLGPDLRFHLAILAATGNELLVPLGALIETALAFSIKISGTRPGANFHALPMHGAVLAAIKSRDPEAARRAMLVLLDESVEDVRLGIAERSAVTPAARPGKAALGSLLDANPPVPAGADPKRSGKT
jgi:DNA-binding FadR family transcriptional regulator